MSALPGGEGPLQATDPAREGLGDLRLYARVEDLAGEEAALLRIPMAERTAQHHERLRAITEELDRVFEHLRERAERLGRTTTPGAGEHRA
jgi:hypothetical protein